ncbi:hypothetical protein SAY86_019902 [Trapa natans]|uniref:UspA domain-containing protein n=1 Tax=Trapa natans TaxID=22666 RepID=A0AAN7R780_TRANT|nr:hypothetical protein SAY86_019902 [Trapa natans]
MASKPVMLVGVDSCEHSKYALEWTLDNFFKPFGSNAPYKLIILHARPTAASAMGFAGAGAADVMPHVENDLKRQAAQVAEKTKEICSSKSVNDAQVEICEGDGRNVLCDAVDKYNASILVVGSHGYGAVKRAVLGSVSDYCAHHAHCTVMIVKKPKVKH